MAVFCPGSSFGAFPSKASTVLVNLLSPKIDWLVRTLVAICRSFTSRLPKFD